MTVGVIISTYNNPRWLEKTLWGYMRQTRKPDEIVVADDGSGEETRELIRRYSDRLPLRHVWHEDRGFRKTTILNKAILASKADYLIFTDQDCVPREDFVAEHCRHARRGRFLSGGYFRLNREVSDRIGEEDIERGVPFDASRLIAMGQKRGFRMLKLTRKRWLAWLLNHITTAKASWNGCNASCMREDAIAVGGFDQRMGYGAEDREFGQRLFNRGLRSKQLRYSLALLHLDHNRPYKDPEIRKRNHQIWKETIRTRRTVTEHGIATKEKEER